MRFCRLVAIVVALSASLACCPGNVCAADAPALLDQPPVLIPIPGWKFDLKNGIFSLGVLTSDIAVSPDGRSVAIRWDATLTDLLSQKPSSIGVSVWNAADGKVKMKATSPRMSGELALETGLAINTDGSRVAICTRNLKKKYSERDIFDTRPGLYQVEVWNVAKGKIDTTLQYNGSLSSMSSLRFSPDGTTLAINAVDAKRSNYQIVQWTVNTRKQTVIDWNDDPDKLQKENLLWDIHYSPSGDVIAGTDGKRIAGWKVDTQKLAFDVSIEQEVVAFHVSDEGKRVVAVALLPGTNRFAKTIEELLKDEGADVISIDGSTGKEVARQRLPTRYLMLSPDGKSVFGRPPEKNGERAKFTQWNVATGEAAQVESSGNPLEDKDGSAYEAEKQKASDAQTKKMATPGAISADGSTIVEEDLDVVRVWTTHKPGDVKGDAARKADKPKAKLPSKPSKEPNKDDDYTIE